MFGISLLGVWISNEALLLVFDIQLNPSTMPTLGTEERGRCREVLNKSQCMGFLSAGAKKGGRCQRGGRSRSFDFISLSAFGHRMKHFFSGSNYIYLF